jgi:hypothetical protein
MIGQEVAGGASSSDARALHQQSSLQSSLNQVVIELFAHDLLFEMSLAPVYV